MELKTIKELISAFKEAELTRFSLKCEEFELKLEKEDKVVMSAAPTSVLPTTLAQTTNVMGSGTSESMSIETRMATQEVKKCIKSPIVGTFYSASNPQAESFVTIGSKVKKGDVVCVIEAMKLMNEVEAEEDGEIIEILVENEEMVEYGQPLFVLK